MPRVLTPDELGEAGETLFANLCVRAGFTCNKSNRDRTGWDFVVEFPMAGPEAGALDARLPTACVIQLKSTATAGPVKLSLSAIERLAKDLRPAFVVVLRLSPEGEGRAGYLIHLLGPALARVLHRLRTAHAQGRFDLNKLTITFDPARFGTRFSPAPDAFGDALRRACGPDPAEYSREKQRQLDELGYEDGGLEAEALFWVESADHLSDVVLGLKPLRPEQLRAYDRRFGIRLPYAGQALDGLEELRIEPPSMGRCTVAIRGAGLSPAAVFEAEMFAGLPALAGEGAWLLVRHADFTLKFSAGAAAFNTMDLFDTTPRSLPRWIHLLRGLGHLAKGDGVITLTPPAPLEAPLTLPMSGKLDGPYLQQLPVWTRFLEGWVRLLEMAGVSSSQPFPLEDLWDARSVALAVDLFGDAPTAWFAFDATDLGDQADEVHAVYINSARLADALVSYAVKVTLSASSNPGEYRSVAFVPLDVRPAVPDLQDYAEELALQHGLTVVINPENIVEIDATQLRSG